MQYLAAITDEINTAITFWDKVVAFWYAYKIWIIVGIVVLVGIIFFVNLLEAKERRDRRRNKNK